MKEETFVDDSNHTTSKRNKGGLARAKKLSQPERASIASKAAIARWAKQREAEMSNPNNELSVTPSADLVIPTPIARYRGELSLMGMTIPCYVLSNTQRVIGRTTVTELLTGIKGGGDLEKYLTVTQFKPFIDFNTFSSHLISFHLPGVEGLGNDVKGLSADLLIELCRSLVSALENSYRTDSETKLTSRQTQMAIQASMFLGAVAKVGLDALIDEATGYQDVREANALAVKLNLYLAEEMRKWEKTFPDELWIQFGRLTRWKGSLQKRPKFWGKLVNELVYGYLDKDVFDWLKSNAPKPIHGKNYHQWLSEQFGLKALMEHIYKLIGLSQGCKDMEELKYKMAQIYGRNATQALLFPEN